jgi:hypothetical protein
MNLKEIMKVGFYLISIAFLINSCSPKIGSKITAKQMPLPDTEFVLVLKENDDFTNDGIEVGSIKSGDNGLSNYCSYFEVLEELKSLARKNGANVIKITELKNPDTWSSCVRLKAKIYQVPNFRIHEKEIYWATDRKLCWEDFKGSPQINLNSNIGALSKCGFGFETNQVSFLSKAKVFTKATFNCNLSWVKVDQKNNLELLEHEQGHFDLSEIYARMFRKKISEIYLTASNINIDTKIIFDKVYNLFIQIQDLYDSETNHGLDKNYQTIWNKSIEKQLNDLNKFSQ